MELIIVGVNHHTAPIALREKVAFTPDKIATALKHLVNDQDLSELAILSTCNRTELYAVKPQLDPNGIVDWLAEYHQLPKDELADSIYVHQGKAAISHVMRVAIGLDSMVLGEPQILGQLKDSFRLAQASGVMGSDLNRLSQQTYRVAKHVRSTTSIGENPVSVASTAVVLASQLFADISTCNALLIGAGETSELVGKHLRGAGISNITIANRSLANAESLAEVLDGQAVSLNDLAAHLDTTDILISSTASDIPILGKGTVERAIKARRHKPIFMVDLAVPRDIEPEVNELADVYLYSMDDLQAIIADNLNSRADAAKDAELQIELAVDQFLKDAKSLDATDTLVKFRKSNETIKTKELEKALKSLKKGDDPESVLKVFASQLTNKLIHIPSVQIKQATIDERHDVLDAVEQLCQLDNDEQPDP